MKTETKDVLVDLENYEEIKSMITSQDEGSRNIALAILNNAHYEKSKVFIISMILELTKYGDMTSNRVKTLLEKEAPELLEKISEDPNFVKGVEGISFRSLYTFVRKTGDKSKMAFLLNVCKSQLTNFLILYGFDFLEHFELDIKLKE